MYTTFHRPTVITPHQLDAWLAQGWFRIGATMMWCRLILFNGALRSTVWTRLDVPRWAPRPGQRRLLRRVLQRYDVSIQPMREVTLEHEAVWQAYRRVARGDRPATAAEALLGSTGVQLFDTWEVSIRDGDRLVAWSWFDLGATAVQSVLAGYDPDHAEQSLGYVTLLLEVDWARRHAFRYHYAGYVMPGEPAMDYKHRVGPLEFLDDQDQWRPWDAFDAGHLPSDRLAGELRAIEADLRWRGVPCTVRPYEMYEAAALNPELSSYLADPLILAIEPRHRLTKILVVTWLPPRGPYRLIQCSPTPGYLRTGANDAATVRTVELLLPLRVLLETPSRDDLVLRAEQSMR